MEKQEIKNIRDDEGEREKRKGDKRKGEGKGENE